ncbi:hypothetical protein GCM10010306_006670 [Streptomyces umbrinus]|uniref:hypothetical protein n=1 Tax=Streptomyces umbrinus TaxID=67370 RepID=UPI001678AB67|nr:hypothetical protein [Streptomyces umbrinus]GHB17385.1 hypothetical protein GCM10010306_006670 [Streptomyces umbrinus]
MSKRITRALVAASVVVGLGCASACSGGDGKDKKAARTSATGQSADASKEQGKEGAEDKDQGQDQAKGSSKGSSVASDADEPLTRAQLKKAALATGDVKGYKVEGAGSADLQGASSPAAPAKCQPVADMFLFTTDPVSRTSLSRGITAKDETDASVTTLALLSYGSGEADDVLAGLRKATGECTAYQYVGYKYSGIKELADPKLGDESVAFRLVASIEGAEVPAAYTVVRDGSTLVAFSSMNMLDADEVEVPAELVEAQLAKLKKTTA